MLQQEAGNTQNRAHSFAQSCKYEDTIQGVSKVELPKIEELPKIRICIILSLAHSNIRIYSNGGRFGELYQPLARGIQLVGM